MKIQSQYWIVTVTVAMAAWATADCVHAHFVWLKSDTSGNKPQAVLIFGEDAEDEAYHLPEPIAAAKIWCRTAGGERKELMTESVETDDRIGLVGPLTCEPPCVLETTVQYGIYHGSLLTYYAKSIAADSNAQIASAGPSPELKLDMVPRAVDGKLELTVLWNGKPQPDAPVSLVRVGESDQFKTDASGKVRIKSPGDGLLAVRSNITDKDSTGTIEGEEYKGGMHFVTLTLPWSQESSLRPELKPRGVKSQESEDATAGSGGLALPEAVSSFGGAVCDGWLYIYSGHIGTEHAHSAENLSQHFRRVKLNSTGTASGTRSDSNPEWEELPMETPLQGLALVAHGGKLYRIGGLNARNATADDDAELFSTTEFACFDPATNKWTALAPLPNPRSSHDAVVIGDKIYVVGGWTLAGEGSGEWLDDSLVYDLANPDAGWQALAEQSFRRRALAAGHWQGKLAVLGGMDDQRDISQNVELFDPATGQWSEGPELPGAGMAGFGLSAWNLDGSLYASGLHGRLYRLRSNGSEWEEALRLDKPRFFHRLLPGGDGTLLAVGGATREGHVTSIEQVDVRECDEAGRTTQLDADNLRTAASP